ncbi:hypothetical protein CO662_04950 [Rhizobium anhuiense]|jgi:hypothetical protein|uniref:Uncharacterized protein n=1 Tax=Rhizobium anhuiense TaxID=1184720 RepID=A0ABX4JC98_9HYPH|nr:hypothetical protein [Rhizobium sp. BK112]MBB3369351.1 hypothetical protein [Rhizobium sp. BK077]MBB3743021.1 hypothetical protein [Rhizobium sp. BK591]MBB4112696.1 hypothetical protein [Rhizobium sp. BK226]MBB4180104.1 hypothetical protein [Rhizobium sp. BK109]MBB4252654.1 hypothetical protein [Rhizobium sp. BK008]PDS40233.1 hypothetical protein CO665_02035 [Rhizobium anhuiense]
MLEGVAIGGKTVDHGSNSWGQGVAGSTSVRCDEPRTVPAIINIKESDITMLASRGRIDAAQLAAATRFPALWEAPSTTAASR